MKSTLRIVYAALILALIPVYAVSAQDKKNEQKIKIVVDDGSGTKILIDTLIKDGKMNDSIMLKNGKVIFIGDNGDLTALKNDEGNQHVFVTVSDNGDNQENVTKTITVVSSDSADRKEKGDGDKVIVMRGKSHNSGKGSASYFYSSGNSKETADMDSGEDKTRYVIAKDGIVVTIEGADEAKTKELYNEIQKNMGVGNSEKQSNVKTQAGKSTKK